MDNMRETSGMPGDQEPAPAFQPQTPRPGKSKTAVIIIAAVILVALAVVLVILLTGKSGGGDDSPSEKNGGQNTVADPDDFTDEQAAQKIKELFKNAEALVKAGNENALKELVIADEGDEYGFNGVKSMLEDVIEQGYPEENEFFELLVRKDDLFLGFFFTSLTTGSDGFTSSVTDHETVPCRYSDGKWFFDRTESTYDALNAALDEKVYAEESGFKAAVDAGRNNAFLGKPDYSWLNASSVVPGTVCSGLYLIWQNEDGSVSGIYVVKNGTDETKGISSVSVRMNDYSLGYVFDVGLDANYQVEPMTAVKVRFDIPAADVKTGTQTWTAYDTNIGISY